MSTLALLVQWRRSPGTVALPWLNPLAKLPSDIWEVLEVANGEEAATAIAAAATGAPGAELRGAALAFIREVLQAPGATFYRRLGVEQSAPIEAIRDNYRDLISVFHPDRMGSDSLPGDADIAAAINEAYNTLKHPDLRVAYDRSHGGAGRSRPWSDSVAATGVASQRAMGRARTRASLCSDGDRGRFSVWLRSRSPTSLKTMAFGGLLALALVSVGLSGRGDAPSLAIQAKDAPEQRGMATMAQLPVTTRPTAMQPLWTVGAGESASPGASSAPGMAGPGNRIGAASAPLAASSATTQKGAGLPPAHTGSGSGETTAIREAEHLPARPADAAAGRLPMATVAPMPSRDLEVASGSAQVRPVAAVGGEAAMRDSAAPTPPAQVAVNTRHDAPVIPASAAASAALSSADVDALLAQFASAYRSGSHSDLVALVDPAASGDNRLAVALASFERVFRDTRWRAMTLEQVRRSQDSDRTTIQLIARTSVGLADGSSRADEGDLLVVARRGEGGALITRIEYHSRMVGG